MKPTWKKYLLWGGGLVLLGTSAIAKNQLTLPVETQMCDQEQAITYANGDRLATWKYICKGGSTAESRTIMEKLQRISERDLSIYPSLRPAAKWTPTHLWNGDFGAGAIGFSAAAEIHFQKELPELTKSETIALFAFSLGPVQNHATLSEKAYTATWSDLYEHIYGTKPKMTPPTPQKQTLSAGALFQVLSVQQTHVKKPLQQKVAEWSTYEQNSAMIIEIETGEVQALSSNVSPLFQPENADTALLPIVAAISAEEGITKETHVEDTEWQRVETLISTQNTGLYGAIMKSVTRPTLREAYRRLGFLSGSSNYSFQNTPKVNVVQVAQAYASLLNDGKWTPLLWGDEKKGWPLTTGRLVSTSHRQAIAPVAANHVVAMMTPDESPFEYTAKWGQQWLNVLANETHVLVFLSNSKQDAPAFFQREKGIKQTKIQPRIAKLTSGYAKEQTKIPQRQTKLIHESIHHETFAYTPNAPSIQNQVQFSSHTPVEWFLNGQTLGSGRTTTWTMKPGRHWVTARAGAEYETVSFEVHTSHR